MSPKNIRAKKPKADEAKSIDIFDLYYPVIELVIPLLPLRDVLSLEQVCQSLQKSAQGLTGAFWEKHLRAVLPAKHPLLSRPACTYSRADVTAYSNLQLALRCNSLQSRCVLLEQILVVSFSPADSLLLVVGDSGGFQGFVRVYTSCDGSLQQACVISPIWTAPECDEHSTEPVHWSRDGKSGLVLIRGRGDYNHVVSLGLGHLALGQEERYTEVGYAHWAMSSNGLLLARWGRGEAECFFLEGYDRHLQEIFTLYEGDGDGLIHSSLGHKLQETHAQQLVPEDNDWSMRRLGLQCASIEALVDRLNEESVYAEPELFCLDFNLRMGVLAVTSACLHYQMMPGRAWQEIGISQIWKLADPPDWHGGCIIPQAFWCPDDTSMMLLGLHGVLRWCCKQNAVVAHCCWRQLLPHLCTQYPAPTLRRLAQCSPDGKFLAILSPNCLDLLNVKTSSLVRTVCFGSQELPQALAWNEMGDQLTLSRGSFWQVMCFGQHGLLGHGDRMTDVLLEVMEDAGSENSEDDVPDFQPEASKERCLDPHCSMDLYRQRGIRHYYKPAV